MRKMMMAALAATMVCGSANATVTTFQVDGTFDNGRTLDGQFTFDDMGSLQQQFTEINLIVSGKPLIDQGVSVSSGSGGYNYLTFHSIDLSTYLTLQLASKIDGSKNFRSISSGVLGSVTHYASSGSSFLQTGRIAVATAAVPEPSSWAMLTIGFGLLGATMRRRKITARLA